MENVKTCCLYLRYSSSSQTEQSIEGQRRVCLEYCQRHGITCVASYEDRATSASHDTEKRHGFQRMIADAEKHPWDCVLVYKLDRFARNRYDSATYKARLKKAGVKLVSATENLSDSPESIILESVLEGMAEFYSAELSQKIHRGLRESALKCNFAGGSIPLGYKIVDKKYVIDEETAPIVQEAFELYTSGHSVKEIIDIFNSKGYRSSKGSKFNHNSFRKMFTNKRYIGYYVFGDMEIENGIPAIIDKDVFERAQMRVKEHDRRPAANRSDIDYLLSGKLFCGHCGATMVGDSGTGRNNTVYYYYSCGNRKRFHTCNKKSVKKDVIEKIVIQEALSLLTDDYIAYFAKITAEEAKKYNAENSRVPALEAKLHEKQTAAKNILAAVEKGIATDIMLQRLVELQAEIRDYTRQIAAEKDNDLTLTEQDVKTWLEQFRDGNIEDKVKQHRLVDLLINSVTLYDEPDGGHKITIAYNMSSVHEKTFMLPPEKNFDIKSSMSTHERNVEPLYIVGTVLVQTVIRYF